MQLARIFHERSLPITLYHRDFAICFHLCTSILFCIIGIMLLPSDPQVGIQSLVFFGTCAVVFIHELRQGSPFLRLEYAGFTLGYPRGRQQKVPWRKVDAFVVVNEKCFKGVGWRYKAAYRTGRRFDYDLSVDIDAMLPLRYGVRAQHLARLMNELRHCYDLTERHFDRGGRHCRYQNCRYQNCRYQNC